MNTALSPLRSRSLRAALVATATLGALSITACGGLSESSTCSDFMHATGEAQQTIILDLASKYQKPAYTSPLGMPAVPYYCASNPDTTLGQFFEAAEG